MNGNDDKLVENYNDDKSITALLERTRASFHDMMRLYESSTTPVSREAPPARQLLPQI